MMKKFKELPIPLKKQTIYRLAFGVLSLLAFALIVIFTRDFILSLPCLLLSVYLLINGGAMLFNCIAGQYVTVQGTCTEIERTALRKRVKAFYISSEKGAWKIPSRHRAKGIAAGADITVYMPSKTRVFEQNDVFIASGYYTYEVRNGLKR